MKVRRTVLVCVIGLFSSGLAGGVAAVLRTIGIYDGACEKLSGFPGALQAAGFLHRGNCTLEPDEDKDREQDRDRDKRKKKHCPPNECTVNGKKGKCVEEFAGLEPACVCRPTKISR